MVAVAQTVKKMGSEIDNFQPGATVVFQAYLFLNSLTIGVTIINLGRRSDFDTGPRMWSLASLTSSNLGNKVSLNK